jgi:hypothetical protein
MVKTETAKLNKDVNTTPTVEAPKEAKEMVTIVIDRETTDGGILVNGKLFVGQIRVTSEQAEDLLRIQEEYFETKKKLMDNSVNVRMKSDDQKEALFLADPRQNGHKREFTRDYGLLGMKEWSRLNSKFKEHLLEQRRMMYNY